MSDQFSEVTNKSTANACDGNEAKQWINEAVDHFKTDVKANGQNVENQKQTSPQEWENMINGAARGLANQLVEGGAAGRFTPQQIDQIAMSLDLIQYGNPNINPFQNANQRLADKNSPFRIQFGDGKPGKINPMDGMPISVIDTRSGKTVQQWTYTPSVIMFK